MTGNEKFQRATVYWVKNQYVFEPALKDAAHGVRPTVPLVFSPSSASDHEIGEKVFETFNHCFVAPYWKYENVDQCYADHQRPDYKHISETLGFAVMENFFKVAVCAKVYWRKDEKQYLFSPMENYRRGFSTLDPEDKPKPPIVLPEGSSAEAFGRCLRLALGYSNPKKNPYRELFFPNGLDKPAVIPEVFLNSIAGGDEGMVPGGVHEKPSSDGPQPWGPKSFWLAVKSRDTHAVAKAMGLVNLQPATWTEKAMEIYEQGPFTLETFVGSPVKGWVLVLCPGLLGRGGGEGWKTLLTKLSGDFGEAQAFGTHRVSEWHLWARAKDGRMMRRMEFAGDEARLEQGGRVTKEELRVLDYAQEEPAEWMPCEEDVLAMAAAWSLDPSEFSPGFPEPVGPGLVGTWPQD